jgi:hypothetical protein
MFEVCQFNICVDAADGFKPLSTACLQEKQMENVSFEASISHDSFLYDEANSASL